MIARNPAAIDASTVPAIVHGRILWAHDLQARRRRIRILGRWYVADDRAADGGYWQRRRDDAARLTRHWRNVARAAGMSAAAVRRAVLDAAAR